MDRTLLVTEIGKLRGALQKREGPLALLMLMADSVGANDWNMIVSGARLDKVSRAEGIRRVTDILRATADRKLWPTIRRVTVLRTDDPFVDAINTLRIQDGAWSELVACNVGGIEIAHAIIFASERIHGTRPHRGSRPTPLGGAAASS